MPSKSSKYQATVNHSPVEPERPLIDVEFESLNKLLDESLVNLEPFSKNPNKPHVERKLKIYMQEVENVRKEIIESPLSMADKKEEMRLLVTAVSTTLSFARVRQTNPNTGRPLTQHQQKIYNEHQKIANKVQGKSSLGWKLLGLSMAALGAVIFLGGLGLCALSLPTFGLGAIAGGGAILGGSLLMASGMGLFKGKGCQTGLAKSMDEAGVAIKKWCL